MLESLRNLSRRKDATSVAYNATPLLARRVLFSEKNAQKATRSVAQKQTRDPRRTRHVLTLLLRKFTA